LEIQEFYKIITKPEFNKPELVVVVVELVSIHEVFYAYIVPPLLR
jgi:hypothetical protein